MGTMPMWQQIVLIVIAIVFGIPVLCIFFASLIPNENTKTETNNKEDPYDCSHVYRHWDKLKEESKKENDSSNIKLGWIAENTYDKPEVRIAAINSLNPTDSRIKLEWIASNTYDKPEVRIAAINSLNPTDSRIKLEWIASSTYDKPEVRIAAANKLRSG